MELLGLALCQDCQPMAHGAFGFTSQSCCWGVGGGGVGFGGFLALAAPLAHARPDFGHAILLLKIVASRCFMDSPSSGFMGGRACLPEKQICFTSKLCRISSFYIQLAGSFQVHT